jgi:hypothetical protein
VQAIKLAREAQREVARSVAERRRKEIEAESKKNMMQIEDILPE